MLSQVLGAVAQLERALIAERTKAGLQAARRRGRVGGNPGLRAGDPAAIGKLRASRDATHLNRVLAQLDTWLPTVRRMRPDQPWATSSQTWQDAPRRRSSRLRGGRSRAAFRSRVRAANLVLLQPVLGSLHCATRGIGKLLPG